MWSACAKKASVASPLYLESSGGIGGKSLGHQLTQKGRSPAYKTGSAFDLSIILSPHLNCYLDIINNG
jgi:hypothetical protein